MNSKLLENKGPPWKSHTCWTSWIHSRNLPFENSDQQLMATAKGFGS